MAETCCTYCKGVPCLVALLNLKWFGIRTHFSVRELGEDEMANLRDDDGELDGSVLTCYQTSCLVVEESLDALEANQYLPDLAVGWTVGGWE